MRQPLIPAHPIVSHCDTRTAVQAPHWEGSEGRPFKGCDAGIIHKCDSPDNDVKGSDKTFMLVGAGRQGSWAEMPVRFHYVPPPNMTL